MFSKIIKSIRYLVTPTSRLFSVPPLPPNLLQNSTSLTMNCPFLCTCSRSRHGSTRSRTHIGRARGTQDGRRSRKQSLDRPCRSCRTDTGLWDSYRDFFRKRIHSGFCLGCMTFRNQAIGSNEVQFWCNQWQMAKLLQEMAKRVKQLFSWLGSLMDVNELTRFLKKENLTDSDKRIVKVF